MERKLESGRYIYYLDFDCDCECVYINTLILPMLVNLSGNLPELGVGQSLTPGVSMFSYRK